MRPTPPLVLARLLIGIDVSFDTREMVKLVADCSEILFFNVPRPVMDTSIVSPDFRNTGGLFPMPTPAGVPVAITSPGLMVMPSEIVWMRKGTEKMRSSIVAFCLSSPFT